MNFATLDNLRRAFTAVKNVLDNKVDKITGKGLSTNDYTNADKTKVNTINSGSTLNNDISGNAATANSADYPTGFAGIDSDTSWGIQTGQVVTSWETNDNCNVIFRKNCPESGRLSQVIDGYFYQNEGQYRCLDESDIDNIHIDTANTAITAKNILHTTIADNSGNIVSAPWTKVMEWIHTVASDTYYGQNMAILVQSNCYSTTRGNAILKIRTRGNNSTGVIDASNTFLTMTLNSTSGTTYIDNNYIKLTYKTTNNITTFKLWHRMKGAYDSYTYTVLAFNDRNGNSLIDSLTLCKDRDHVSSDYMTEGSVTADGKFDCTVANISNNAATANSADNVSGTADGENAARHVWFSDETIETQRVYNDNFTYNPSTNTLTANISGKAASATRLGTTTKGSGIQPIYLFSGIPIASTSTVGSASKPVYLENGVITETTSITASKIGTTNKGSSTKPIYLASGTPTASTGNVGSGTQPMYMVSGELTASTSTVGAANKPVYLNAGNITASNSTIGDGTIPIAMKNGEFIAATTGGGGGGAELIYQFNGSTTSFIGGGGVSRNSAKPITIQNLSNYSLIVLNGTYYAYNGGLSFKRMFSTTIPLEELKLYKSDSSNQGFELSKDALGLTSDLYFWYESTNVLKIGYYARDYTKEGIITAKIYAVC